MVNNRRVAVMRISGTLLRSLLPEYRMVGIINGACGLIPTDEHDRQAAVIHKALLLPDNARITGISAVMHFAKDEILLCIECPDFVDVPEGCTAPEVICWYWGDPSQGVFGEEKPLSHARFDGWSNDAAVRGDVKQGPWSATEQSVRSPPTNVESTTEAVYGTQRDCPRGPRGGVCGEVYWEPEPADEPTEVKFREST